MSSEVSKCFLYLWGQMWVQDVVYSLDDILALYGAASPIKREMFHL